MDLPGDTTWRTRLKRGALAFDAWLNDALHEGGQRLSDAYQRFANRVDKLALSGGQRVAAELASEAMTIGTAGAMVMLVLAVPAFR